MNEHYKREFEMIEKRFDRKDARVEACDEEKLIDIIETNQEGFSKFRELNLLKDKGEVKLDHYLKEDLARYASSTTNENKIDLELYGEEKVFTIDKSIQF
mmetsp:Transcript_10506/g.17616  ORF Transcript_10506/g.17616 Transcript_10506/m.17616 type:complete len:100 (-) Transcript_10506:1959-2258(-)